jgi:hypothetical protein
MMANFILSGIFSNSAASYKKAGGGGLLIRSDYAGAESMPGQCRL